MAPPPEGWPDVTPREPDAALRTALDDLLTGARPTPGLRRLFACGLGPALLPEVAALDLPQPNGKLHKDNLTHSLTVCGQAEWGPGIRVLDETPPDALRLLRWGALLHDVGKAPTRKIEESADGRTVVTFWNHESVGASLARALLARLGYPRAFGRQVGRLVLLSGRTHGFDTTWTDSSVRRFLTDAGPLADLVLDISRADCTSARPGRRAEVAAQVDDVATRARAVRLADERAAIRPALTGDQIMALLGLPAGREVGAARTFLLGFAQAGEILTEEEAARRLLDWAARRAD